MPNKRFFFLVVVLTLLTTPRSLKIDSNSNHRQSTAVPEHNSHTGNHNFYALETVDVVSKSESIKQMNLCKD